MSETTETKPGCGGDNCSAGSNSKQPEPALEDFEFEKQELLDEVKDLKEDQVYAGFVEGVYKQDKARTEEENKEEEEEEEDPDFNVQQEEQEDQNEPTKQDQEKKEEEEEVVTLTESGSDTETSDSQPEEEEEVGCTIFGFYHFI